ncbi:hypothetical protein EF294_03380 [Gordonia oryzae]|uniref:Uncharacterized protein n=1 Tax=Gordonia oryzae TaxID=2487349 RepID=A0A3N4H369_9ACTN|nr:hypothetical protein EF294_03380 [Gordonia oryzae]
MSAEARAEKTAILTGAILGVVAILLPLAIGVVALSRGGGWLTYCAVYLVVVSSIDIFRYCVRGVSSDSRRR